MTTIKILLATIATLSATIKILLATLKIRGLVVEIWENSGNS
ncbi:MAG: hypothetical protein ACYDCN_15405 [Bacteroidia bacterium]